MSALSSQPDCNIQDYLRAQEAGLIHAVKQGHMIVISLGRLFGMPRHLYDQFNNRARVPNPDTDLQAFIQKHKYPDSDRDGHFKVGVKNIEDLFHVLAIIQEHGGRPTFDKVFIAWHGWILPYHIFLVNSAQKQRDLFDRLYIKAMSGVYSYTEKDPKCAFGMPRLLSWHPNFQHSRLNKQDQEIVSQVVAYPDKYRCEKPRLLRNRMQTQSPAVDQSVFGKGLYILAAPCVDPYPAESARWIRANNPRHRQPQTVHIDWYVTSMNQILIRNACSAPRSYPKQDQMLLI